MADWRVLTAVTNATTARRQLRDCARAASAAWPQLLQSWSWAEVNQHDAIRRLLLRAVAWANEVGENNAPVDVRIAQDLIAQIDRTIWPEAAVPMRQSIRRCAELALCLAPRQPPPKISDLPMLVSYGLYQLTPKGLKRDAEATPEQSIALFEQATVAAGRERACARLS